MIERDQIREPKAGGGHPVSALQVLTDTHFET